MNYQLQDPPRPRLNPARRQVMLEAVLDDCVTTLPTPSHRSLLVPAAAAAAAIVTLGAGAVFLGGSGDPGPSNPGFAAGPAGTGTKSIGAVPLDLGPLDEAEAQQELERCLAAMGTPDQDGYQIEYARRVDGPDGPRPAIVASRGNATIHCVASTTYTWTDGETGLGIPGYRGGEELPEPDAEQPVVVAATGGNLSTTAADEGTVTSWIGDAWLLVSPEVATVETRVGTADGTEPWHTSTVYGGWVYTAAWFERTYARDDAVWYETRTYDADGNLIDTGDELAPEQVDTWIDREEAPGDGDGATSKATLGRRTPSSGACPATTRREVTWRPAPAGRRLPAGQRLQRR